MENKWCEQKLFCIPNTQFNVNSFMMDKKMNRRLNNNPKHRISMKENVLIIIRLRVNGINSTILPSFLLYETLRRVKIFRILKDLSSLYRIIVVLQFTCFHSPIYSHYNFVLFQRWEMIWIRKYCMKVITFKNCKLKSLRNYIWQKWI